MKKITTSILILIVALFAFAQDAKTPRILTRSENILLANLGAISTGGGDLKAQIAFVRLVKARDSEYFSSLCPRRLEVHLNKHTYFGQRCRLIEKTSATREDKAAFYKDLQAFLDGQKR